MKITVKVGSSTLTHESGNLNIRRIESLVKVLSDLKNAGHEIVLVSSGAIAMGIGKLHLHSKPEDLPGKQAAAAVGQCELIHIYDKLFTEYNHVVAQLLLTGEDFDHPDRLENLSNTLFKLFEYDVIPIINENDSTCTSEISVGDNDSLSALVAKTVESDLLILLSDIDGLYDSDPHQNYNSEFISVVEKITPAIEALGGAAGSNRGTGGMATKIHAAKIATEAGMDMVVANGRRPEILYDIVDNKRVGTRFLAQKKEDDSKLTPRSV
nr:glutamate 5-kinase [Lachnospiraceae bacterium]